MAIFRFVQPSFNLTHEDVFLARYERLLAWARPLVDGNEAVAEDLLHDAFIQFSLAQPDLDDIENLDAYLRRMLRNLRVSQVRRSAHKLEQSLCRIDCDSAALGLQAEAAHAGLDAREELQLICQYALARRRQSKAASVLLLRYFHGYLPTEIARLMRVDEAAGRGAVKQWLSLARREARQYLHEPQSRRFIGPLPETPEIRIAHGLQAPEFLQALRTAIFATPPTQACPSARQWKAVYRTPGGEAMETARLAHLVCCAACLERVTALLGLASLSERFPDDPNDSGAKGNERRGREQARGREAWRQQSRRQGAERREHYPAELHVYANGFYVASHTVEAEINRLSLKLHLDEPLAFIEIFSEQGARLLYLPVGETASALKQTARLGLSDQRILDASLHFVSTWPTLELNYCGARSAESLAKTNSEVEALTSRDILVESASAPQSHSGQTESASRLLSSALHRMLRPVTLTLLLSGLLIAVVVGEKLVWWLAPAKPAATPNKRDPRLNPSGAATSGNESHLEPRTGATGPADSSLPPPSASSSTIPIPATAELEIEALRLLQQAKADTHEQIEVRRTSSGKLRIEGILETDARESELRQALSSLRDHPAVELQLQTVAKATQQLRTTTVAPSAGVLERDEIAAVRLPVDAELRRYFATRGLTDERLEAEIHRFAARTLAQSRQAARHAGALKNLAARFGRDESLTATARAKWRALQREHVRALHAEILALRAALAPLFAASPVNGARDDSVPALASEADLRRATESLAALCAETDRALIAALTLSSAASLEGSPAAALNAPGFWTGLHRGEHLSAAIDQYLSDDQ